MATIAALYAGRIETVDLGGRETSTAIRKRPRDAVELDAMGVVGDEQADRHSHGGPDKAVCVYAGERYRVWHERLGRPLEAPAFGENARVLGRTEDDVVLGEVWQVGEARLQVTQPRVPCWMPGALNGEPRLTAWMCQSGFTGYLLRVLAAGTIEVGAAIEVVERPDRPLTILELNRLRYRDTVDVAGLRHALASDGLLQSWRELLEEQLQRAGG